VVAQSATSINLRSGENCSALWIGDITPATKARTGDFYDQVLHRLFVSVLGYAVCGRRPNSPVIILNVYTAFIPAESIDDAAESARTYLFERWKLADGWHTHQTNIMVLGDKQIAAIREALAAGVIDVSEESPRTYNF
jgi:hypothetical protein